MTISFACPHCGEKLTVPDEAAGRTGKCSQCNGAITVPTPVTPPPSHRKPLELEDVSDKPMPRPRPPRKTPAPLPKMDLEGFSDQPAPRAPGAARSRPAPEELPALDLDETPRKPVPPTPIERTPRSQRFRPEPQDPVDGIEEIEEVDSLVVDRPPAQPEPAAPSNPNPLAFSSSLKPRRAWAIVTLVRLVSVLVVFLGLYSLLPFMGVAKQWVQQAIASVQSLVGHTSLAQELGRNPLGPAPMVFYGFRLVAAVMLICGGVRGAILAKKARKMMFAGMGTLVVVTLAYSLGRDYGLPDAWFKNAPTTVGIFQPIALLVISGAIGSFLHLSEKAIARSKADVFSNVTELVNSIFSEAVAAQASDVHIEPTPEGVVVRYRVDGVLHPAITYPPRALERIVSRIKVLANMDIAERRMPQDGGATLNLAGRDIDLRVSTVPGHMGERVVVRILDRATGLYGLQALGMQDKMLNQMDRVVKSPHGVFFCTGPTGSGKTTTLYAALIHLNREERNVITVEDPVEYFLPGITQLPVGAKKGMTFASGLRSILRQDPDVIMVGEVRDHETAQMVIQAAQTGHLVLSTLHTNDSAGAVSRLLDLDVEPFLLASSLMAVLAQRLVRRICPACAEEYAPTAEELREVGLPLDGSVTTLRRGRGCPACMNTGYRGRIGLFELLTVDGEIRHLITARADSVDIHDQAVKAGMISLREDGRRKILAGLTTTEEVKRVTQGAMLG